MKEPEIREIVTDEEFEAATELLTKVFGPRKNLTAGFKKWLNDPSVSVLAAFLNQKVAGVAVVQVDSSHGAAYGKKAETFLYGRKSGSFLILSVSPEFRKSGIGESLAARQMQWLSEQSCQVVLGTAWNHGSSDHSSHLFIKGGFSPLGELKDFYREGSQKDGHICPVCHGVCHCSATLYALTL